MIENLTAPADMTEEQAKAEVEKMQIEIRLLLEQIKHDREASQHITARADATMARVNEGLDRLLAR